MCTFSNPIDGMIEISLNSYLCQLFYDRQLKLLCAINRVVLNENNHNGIKVIFDIDIQTGRFEIT